MYVRNYQPGSCWLPGVIQDKTGPVSYQERMLDDHVRRCHLDQIQRRTVEEPPVLEEVSTQGEALPEESTTLPVPQVESTPDNPEDNSPSPEAGVDPALEVPAPVVSKPATAVEIYPTRNHKIVSRYEPSW